MTPVPLAAWLEKLERRSPEARVDLGLGRVQRVRQRLKPALGNVPVITVAGTNGKGSTVAYLEAIFRAAGYRVMAYTSPHLLRFAERIRIDAIPAADTEIVWALEAVEAARENEALTYFEHVTLAALALAARSAIEVLILEVGLGGRLDAVNVVDPDVAIVTSIGLDHTEWLGRTRRAIGREKAGIARPGRPLIVGERRLPRGFLVDLQATDADLQIIGKDFRTRRRDRGFRLYQGRLNIDLPLPTLAGDCQLDNAACAVLAARALGDRCPVATEALAAGLSSASVPGRQEVIQDRPLVIVDVAHNTAAARQLAKTLGPSSGASFAVFAALADKNAGAMARILDDCFDVWLAASLDGPRGVPAERLAAELAAVPVTGSVEALESAATAVGNALRRCGPNGRVVVFGSFRTVAEAWPELEKLG